jgi:hypothetical protein
MLMAPMCPDDAVFNYSPLLFSILWTGVSADCRTNCVTNTGTHQRALHQRGAVRNPDYTASNGWMEVNNAFGKMWKEVVVAQLKVINWILYCA